MNKISVKASYPSPGRLNIVFSPPIQTWRFPGFSREEEGRRAALDACRLAVRQKSVDRDDPPTTEIEGAIEAALVPFMSDGRITVP